MQINSLDKINFILREYSILGLLPNIKKRIACILRPADIVRYIEFPYLWKFMTEKSVSGTKILDVSSPHMMAYVLSRKNDVIKTNIDESERSFIKEHDHLHFKIEDATKLSFPDNTFDLTYSISVIEHIYGGYTKAIQEMIRVTKKGGFIYITYPVAKTHIEEWLDGYIYPTQEKSGSKSFLQYRFDDKDIESLLAELKDVTILRKDIFWEKKDGTYDKIMPILRKPLSNTYTTFIRDVFLNMKYGFTMFYKKPDADFINAKSLGNMHLILEKI